MNADLVEFLACPNDEFFPLRLSVRERAGGNIHQGELLCPSCRHQVLIEAGIPRFVPVGTLTEVQKHEMELRDQAHRARRYEMRVVDLPEFDAVKSALGDCSSLRALDAGCGGGKMTPAMGNPSRLVGVDFSSEALLNFHFRSTCPVDLIQADVSRMPFRENSFDICLSTQVLQHLPSKALRVAFLGQIARALKPGSKLVLTVYNWNRSSKEPKEGFYESGLFYHKYDLDELRAELDQWFAVKAIHAVSLTFALASYFPLISTSDPL